MTTKPTADWIKLGSKFYRKIQLYTDVFDQDLELENYVVTGCSYGGAIVLSRDETKLHSFRGTQASKSSIDIYSCAGKLIRQINWDKGSIRGLGWSEDEKLLVITADGIVRCYYDLQGDFTQFSLGNGAEEHGVDACRFYDTGFVAILGNNKLIAVSKYEEPRPKLLATPPAGDVHSWTLISPAHTLSRSVEVLLSIGQTIHVADALESEDRMLDIGPFQHISVSPNGKFVALYTENGKAYVITSDFQNRLSEYDSKSRSAPKDLQWCGNDAVVIAWEDEVHIIGPNSAVAKYFYDGRVHLIADYDGVRLITNDVCDYLQKVPDATDEVFRFDTESPASILLDAVEQLEQRSPKADDNIQLIRPHLVEAVDTCVKAAGQEYNIHWQKQLLKAASFGKSVLDIYNSDEFVDMCETLRVLNAVRYYEIGLPISSEQYLRLTPEKLVSRLINRHEYLLAIKISSYLRLPTDRIYVHWASQKVRVGTEDEETISRLIVKKLSGKRGISFEEIARSAYDEGRGRLATELLNYEPRAGKQVPLLLSMEEDEIALDKAIESGDSDLLFYVLLHLKHKLPLSSFFRIINTRPTATSLIESTAHTEDASLLKDLYYQDDRRLEGSNVFVREALTQPNTSTTIDKLQLASKLLSDSKESSISAQRSHLSEAIALLKIQENLQRELSHPFVGTSLHATITTLITRDQLSRARRISNDFRLAEKTYQHLLLRSLVHSRNWAAIEDFIAKNKKSPIGWKTWFEAIVAAGNLRLAGTALVPKCVQEGKLESGEAARMYEACGMKVKAAEDAVRRGDRDTWERLRSETRGTGEGREVEHLGAGLKK